MSDVVMNPSATRLLVATAMSLLPHSHKLRSGEHWVQHPNSAKCCHQVQSVMQNQSCAAHHFQSCDLPDICCGGEQRLHRSSQSCIRLAAGEGQSQLACKHNQVHDDCSAAVWAWSRGLPAAHHAQQSYALSCCGAQKAPQSDRWAPQTGWKGLEHSCPPVEHMVRKPAVGRRRRHCVTIAPAIDDADAFQLHQAAVAGCLCCSNTQANNRRRFENSCATSRTGRQHRPDAPVRCRTRICDDRRLSALSGCASALRLHVTSDSESRWVRGWLPPPPGTICDTYPISATGVTG